MHRVLALAFLCTLACDSGTTTDKTDTDTDVDTMDTDTMDTDVGPDGEALFLAICAACHGTDGSGGIGSDIRNEGGKSDAELVRIMREGEGSMAAQNVTEEEAQAIVDYMRSDIF